ncbi:MAG: DUF998 domain-containing protein [Acidimicrobiia bacterium]|nr:DUF998 domain-containing protein [Acidimicrobiia bacterium]
MTMRLRSLRSWPRPGVPSGADARSDEARATRRIHRWVGVAFYVASFVILRDVLFAIPSILAGDAVINGDELVPFFNPTTQLFDQARGEFSPLTNGFEFRVRYSFLTTWLRHYKVLPFAILLVLPTIFWSVYLTVSRFVSSVFRRLSPVSVALAAAFPTALIYLIATYAKVTHFYTLLVGLALMTMAVLLMLYGLLFATDRWVRYVVGACLIILFNPAVHYVVLFAVFWAVAGVTLALGELARWIRRGGPGRLHRLPGRLRRIGRSPYRARLVRRAIRGTILGRGAVAGLLFLVITLIPYALFVKFLALRGVENLAVTVPGDYYFIRDASVSWLHVLSWDLAGIMDKILFGDYLAKVPRYPNVVYSLLLLAPLVLRPMRRTLLVDRSHRQLFGVWYATVGFAVWATIGYAEPQWFPTFHRSMAAVARVTEGTPLGGIALDVSSTVVQVLRFPHRFQLILFVLAPVIMTLTLAWSIDTLHRRWMANDAGRSLPQRTSMLLRGAATLWVAAVFFIPFWSNAPYRDVYGSGNFGDFLAPFPVMDLQELKQELLALPEGKTVVLPPTETAKLVTDSNGVDHKFNDKFFIYYLDEPSFYYGLTGEADNKFEFFLILRGLYYQQDWWINPARDIGIRYLVVNNNLRDNRGVGAEYLPNVESYIGPALERQEQLGFVELRFENDTYRLYELTDRARVDRETLLVDSSWSEYLDLVFDRLELSRCYDFEYLPYYEPDGTAEPALLLSADPVSAALDLYAVEQTNSFYRPSSKGFAFNPDVVTSAYYQSPMFRLFLFLSNTRWNRTEIITPGLFGTLRGSFVAVPRATRLTVPVSVSEPGTYRVLLRGAATANDLEIGAPTLDFRSSLEACPVGDSLEFFTQDSVYTENRVPVATAQLSVEDLEDRIGENLVPVNVRFTYLDLGTVEAPVGGHTFTITKHDDNPLLVEGLVLIPESEFAALTLPAATAIVDDPARLECAARHDVFDSRDLAYVDPAANPEHENLSNEELLSLAAAGVTGLEPEDGGGFRYDWIVLVLTGGLLGGATLVVRSHSRPRNDEDSSTKETDPKGDTHD